METAVAGATPKHGRSGAGRGEKKPDGAVLYGRDGAMRSDSFGLASLGDGCETPVWGGLGGATRDARRAKESRVRGCLPRRRL